MFSVHVKLLSTRIFQLFWNLAIASQLLPVFQTKQCIAITLPTASLNTRKESHHFCCVYVSNAIVASHEGRWSKVGVQKWHRSREERDKIESLLTDWLWEAIWFTDELTQILLNNAGFFVKKTMPNSWKYATGLALGTFSKFEQREQNQ